MITSIYTYEFRGLSTDDKSEITNMTNGSIFFEMDTSKVYMYDAQNEQWRELQ